MAIRRMRIACRITETTNTHSEYVIIFAVPTATTVARTRLSVTLYVHCVSYMNAGSRREVADNCVLPSVYTASSGNFLPTFRENLSIPS